MFLGYDIDDKIIELANDAEKELQPIFKKYEKNAMFWSAKVLKAFQNNAVSTSDFAEITGYGYTDEGRDKLERIYAEVFGAEDALVRCQIMSGTHALSLTLFGLLNYGDTFISITGEPYDSLRTVIGTEGNSRNSLIKKGVKYEQIDLKNNDFDIDAITKRLKSKNVKLVEIQRSRGYSQRESLTIDKIEKVCKAIKETDPNVIIMVDNCYGDFVEEKEPTEIGADILVGSSLKNLGGGNAKTGGYIVGKKELISDVAECFSAPGLGKEIGANLNQNLSFFKGIFDAPSVVCNALKAMTFASYCLDKLGYEVSPKFSDRRTDIIQTVNTNSLEAMVKFCKGLQSGSPIESYVTPVPSPMPGYPNEEVSAGGSFIEGSTIELSADGPTIPPYTLFMQGSLTYEYGKLGIMIALNEMIKNN